jgi:hypothetical protein
MGERVKKDVKLLLILALVISLFNVISIQVFLYNMNVKASSSEFGGAVLPGEERQKDVIVSGNGKNTGDNTESNVYDYVNGRLKKYGYGPIDSNSESSESSNQEEESESVIYLNGNPNSNQENNQNQNNQQNTNQNNNQNSANNQNPNSNENSNQQNNEPENNPEEEEQPEEEEDEDNGLPIIPPNEGGPPATTFNGSIKFGVSSGLG